MTVSVWRPRHSVIFAEHAKNANEMRTADGRLLVASRRRGEMQTAHQTDLYGQTDGRTSCYVIVVCVHSRSLAVPRTSGMYNPIIIGVYVQ